MIINSTSSEHFWARRTSRTSPTAKQTRENINPNTASSLSEGAVPILCEFAASSYRTKLRPMYRFEILLQQINAVYIAWTTIELQLTHLQ
jgi:hypothetical protein